MTHRILVIEDDIAIGNLLRTSLAGTDTQVELEPHGARGLHRATSDPWDLYIIDWMLPGMDGVNICHSIRAQGHQAPVIMLTARDTEPDRVRGLDAGADDYIGKPFGLAELKARVRAQLRRHAPMVGQIDAPIQIGPVFVDPRTRRVEREGMPVMLTTREFQLLHHLMRHSDRAWSREQLLHKVWGMGYDGYAHTVNSHINRLRAKLEPDAAKPTLIVTIWGEGYRFAAEAYA